MNIGRTLETLNRIKIVDILTEIIAKKKERLAAAKIVKPERVLRQEAIAARHVAVPHALIGALDQNARVNIIAEFKRRSPSKGVICADADPAATARDYERGGAVAVSVLTEQDFFDGSLDDLRVVREVVSLPILRKDFIVDQYQVYESAAAGADSLLLIVAALDDASLAHLRRITEDELGMDALVEVHTSEELKRALACDAKLIGVNNRDLRTFNVSLETSIELAREAPADVVLISESGLNTRADLLKLQSHGYRGFLMGESLMRANNVEATLRVLIA
jgi:indole-3-glycerol phosphate synthase